MEVTTASYHREMMKGVSVRSENLRERNTRALLVMRKYKEIHRARDREGGGGDGKKLIDGHHHVT